MTDKITVELDRELAERFIKRTANYDGPFALIRNLLRAALPPEWEEGAFAKVWFDGEDDTDKHVVFAQWVNGEWRHANGLGSFELRNNVTKVEPIRVLKDDEVAVRQPPIHPDDFRRAASILEDAYFLGLAGWLREYAAEAEK